MKHNRFTVLFDKGYHKGKELDKVQRLGVKTLVAVPGIPKTSQAPNPKYNAQNFIYDQNSDTYTCPANQTLLSTHTWYETPNYRFKQYKTPACSNCPVKSECTVAKNGKIIQRSEYQCAVEQNKANLRDNPGLYNQRQSLVEHPFGTMKRQWGFDYIITKKTRARASADIGFIFIAYNLRRIFNLIGKEELRAFFKSFCAPILLLKIMFKPFCLVHNILRFISIQFPIIRLSNPIPVKFSYSSEMAIFKLGF